MAFLFRQGTWTAAVAKIVVVTLGVILLWRLRRNRVARMAAVVLAVVFVALVTYEALWDGGSVGGQAPDADADGSASISLRLRLRGPCITQKKILVRRGGLLHLTAHLGDRKALSGKLQTRWAVADDWGDRSHLTEGERHDTGDGDGVWKACRVGMVQPCTGALPSLGSRLGRRACAAADVCLPAHAGSSRECMGGAPLRPR